MPKHFNTSYQVRTGVHLRIQNNWAGNDGKICAGAAEAAGEHKLNVHVRFQKAERGRKERKRREKDR